jgi:hypothetical protein
MHRSVVTHQSTAWCRSHGATSRCTAGSERRRHCRRGGKRVASATLRGMMGPLRPLQPDQQAIGQHDGHGVPMKPRPQAALILVPAQLALGLFMQLRDRMPPMGIPGQCCEGDIRGPVAPDRVPFLGRPLGRSLPHQPARVTVSVTGHPPAAHRHALLPPPAVGAPPPATRAPLPTRHRPEPFIRPTHRAGRRASPTHREVGPHRHHIPLVPGLHAPPNVGVSAIVGIGHYTPLGSPHARA